jgi:hypothetical protein
MQFVVNDRVLTSLGGTTMNIFWARGVSGDFATASNWNPAAVPGAADDVTIGVKGTYTVISSANETVDGLTITDKHATLLVTGQSSFSTSSGINDGKIIADSGSSLTITSNNSLPTSFENSGTLEATNANNLPTGGSLAFFDVTIINTPQGVIEANGANTRVDLGLAGPTTIIGGTLETRGANAILGSGSGLTLDGTQCGNPVNIEGNFLIGSEAAVQLMGTIDNKGVITMRGGDFPWLITDGNVILEGGGHITLINAPPNPFGLAPSIFGGVLTNVNNVISGTGEIGQQLFGDQVGTFINETKGVIDANDANGPLVIAGVGPDPNAGLIEATQGGTLLIENVTIDNFLHHTNGTLEAGHNSTIGLENATITGGLVKTLSGAIIEAEQGSNTITGAQVKNAGTIGAESANLTIVGDVNNHKGNLDANDGRLVIDGAVKGGTATIEGTGEIEFGGPSSAKITFAANSDAILKLDKPSTFTGTVSGLTTGDYLDFANINFADNPTVSYSSKTHVLTVTDSVSHVTDSIKLAGTVGSFSAQSDGNSGTLITDPPPSTNIVAVAHDSFVFAPNLGENAGNATNHVQNNEPIDFSHHGGELADLAALMVQAHAEGAHLLATPDAVDGHHTAVLTGHHSLA